MKTVRANYSESHYGQFSSEVHDEVVGRSYINGWVIDDDYFVASEGCPKFDPRDGSPLTYTQESETHCDYQESRMKWVVEHVDGGYQIFDLMGCVIPCDSLEHAEFMAKWFTERSVSGKGDVDCHIADATLTFYIRN